MRTELIKARVGEYEKAALSELALAHKVDASTLLRRLIRDAHSAHLRSKVTPLAAPAREEQQQAA